MTEILIGLKASDHISMSILSNPPTDGEDWINVAVELQSGPFSGNYHASMMQSEFVEFKKQVIALYASLVGTAKFYTIEGQLEFSMVGNERGAITVSGHGFGSSDYMSKIEFKFTIDQTFLIDVLNNLEWA